MVEDSLDEQLVGMIVPGTGEADEEARSRQASADDVEFRQVTEAVLRECIVNLARIKEAVAHSVERPREAQAIEQIPQLVKGITAGLLMLGKSRAAEIMDGIDQVLARFVHSDGMTLPQDAIDRFADAIVAVEYYMETLQAGRTDPWYMLDNAEACLRFLAQAEPVARADTFAASGPDHSRTVVIESGAQTFALPTQHEPTAVLDPDSREGRIAAAVRSSGASWGDASGRRGTPSPPGIASGTAAPAQVAADPDEVPREAATLEAATPEAAATDATRDRPAATQASASPPADGAVAVPPVLVVPEDREIDPEFIEIFIEEAKEEIARLRELCPRWDMNPQDHEALVILRRSFHTL
jgi:chemosensory pili system protein ChpA (sensor histidine kinase/response regulator)